MKIFSGAPPTSAETLRRRNAESLGEAYAYARRNSPFYRERLRRMPADLAEPAWRAVPFTTKQDLRDAYPFGMLAVPRERIVRYGESTGSTGRPTSSYMTAADWERGAVWVELSLLNFFGPEDMVFIAIPYELSFAACDLDRSFTAIGAAVVANGTLNSVCPWARTLQMMRTLRPSILVCTPSRAGRVADMFDEQQLEAPNSKGLGPESS